MNANKINDSTMELPKGGYIKTELIDISSLNNEGCLNRNNMKEEIKITIPEGYKFDCIEGEEIILKKKVEFPNTFDECNRLIGSYYYASGLYTPKENDRAITALGRLLICRNSWWKILRWKPDWSSHYQNKYTIIGYKGGISITETELCNTILAFPTEKVRNQFYETFKDLIEEAKELL